MRRFPSKETEFKSPHFANGKSPGKLAPAICDGPRNVPKGGCDPLISLVMANRARIKFTWAEQFPFARH